MKKFKHRLVIEATFDRELIESDAYHIMRKALDTTNMNQRVGNFFIAPKPKIRNFTIKRWSRVMAYFNHKE